MTSGGGQLVLLVRRADVDVAAGIGAAVCASVGTELHRDWEPAVRAMVGRIEDAATFGIGEQMDALTWGQPRTAPPGPDLLVAHSEVLTLSGD